MPGTFGSGSHDSGRTVVCGRARGQRGAEANIGRVTLLQRSSSHATVDCLSACGTSAHAAAPRASPVHVEAAAWAALLAWRHSAGGVFNIAEDNPEVDSGKARRLLGWTPSMRLGAEARS
ncbi:hypothetical protein ACEN8K_31130 [Variovorax sp. CT11-76]